MIAWLSAHAPELLAFAAIFAVFIGLILGAGSSRSDGEGA